MSRGKTLGQVNGSGGAGFERHKLATIESKIAYLTNHGKRVRDRFTDRVVQIEQDWMAAYGKKTVDDLRSALERVNTEIDTDLPDYVNTTSWLTDISHGLASFDHFGQALTISH